MSAHHVPEPTAPTASAMSWFVWLGGGNRPESPDRSAYPVVGVLVLINVVVTWLATTFAGWPTMRAAVPFTLALALLVGATGRVIAAGTTRRATAVAAVVLALVLGVVSGECATLALFSGAIDRLLEQQATDDAVSAPAVVQQSANLRSLRETRAVLDHAVDAARGRRDEALVIARCEYHPTSACPQSRITGVPGSGPETRTANQLLADSQRELDQAVAARDGQTPGLMARTDDGERDLAQARQHAAATSERGMGARWIAMQQLTSARAGMLTLRVLTDGFFVFLGLLPLFLRRSRADTSHDRHARARAERETAELLADTAIAVKRAEVRAAAENLWAEQQLARTRLAVEAQTEIDRAQLRQRVDAAITATTPRAEPADDDIYLPIAAEAHAASLAAAASTSAEPSQVANLPATVNPGDVAASPAIRTIPDVTRAAARWIRPLVPDFVSRAIDTSTHPLRTARQVIEEVEHITFSFTRTRRVTVETEEGLSTAPRAAANDALVGGTLAVTAAVSADDERQLTTRVGAGELDRADGPRQLPPAG